MTADRDLKVARLALRLHVGQDGDPLDNDILSAYESLPESTIIRNDWIRRRLVIGHLLEREGISGLLAVIGSLSGGSVASNTDTDTASDDLRFGSAGTGYEAPVFNEGPAAEIQQRVSAPAPEEARSAKKKMLGLMPVIPAPDSPGSDKQAAAEPKTEAEAKATTEVNKTAESASEAEDASSGGPGKSPPGQAFDRQAADNEAPSDGPAQTRDTSPDELSKPGLKSSPRVRIEASQQPVIRIPTADQPALLGEQAPIAKAGSGVAAPVPDATVGDAEHTSEASRGPRLKPVLEPESQ